MTHGQLAVTIWPAYIGLGPEPYGDFDYSRGQIAWRQEGADIVGGALCRAPKGVYTHLLFFRDVHQPPIGSKPLEHPIVFTTPGYIDIDPIRNQDYLPRGAA